MLCVMPKTYETKLTGNVALEFVATMAQLDAVVSASDTIVGYALSPARPGSPIARAGTDCRDAYDQARLLFMSAEDHFTTVLLLLQGNALPMFALYSLVRPAAEAAVRSAYLLDPALDETQRLARGLNVRLENLLQQDKIHPNAAHLDAAITRLEAKASANGIPVLHPKKDPTGRTVGFGKHQMSNEVELFDAYLPPNGALIYRFLCGHVHCLPWVKLSQQTAVPSGEPGISIAPMELDVPTFLGVLAPVLRLHEQNIPQLLALADYPRDVWTQTKDSALRRARERYAPLLTVEPVG